MRRYIINVSEKIGWVLCAVNKRRRYLGPAASWRFSRRAPEKRVKTWIFSREQQTCQLTLCARLCCQSDAPSLLRGKVWTLGKVCARRPQLRSRCWYHTCRLELYAPPGVLQAVSQLGRCLRYVFLTLRFVTFVSRGTRTSEVLAIRTLRRVGLLSWGRSMRRVGAFSRASSSHRGAQQKANKPRIDPGQSLVRRRVIALVGERNKQSQAQQTKNATLHCTRCQVPRLPNQLLSPCQY